ncbi:unnamed protein product (macronuclear) [Paramecium tetraurelia]|uniref:Uncharacterized protein n=1 Tax=Paramecium tetraurelia TaxID=5888 RepID=A0CGJ8_PARTE|nr:uncharacterized protein GSPATT00007355001 [Paramecium tetraurelia]CAK69915.1 unnamed protein product [Paramecium tetraurelia]|eukprot:XP_001437312.1 hypothetical protein (macronuclear) [Paramecium tetraurelia strain d4-2]
MNFKRKKRRKDQNMSELTSPNFKEENNEIKPKSKEKEYSKRDYIQHSNLQNTWQ